MAVTRRKFTLEFKTEAAHRVIDSGRPVREVARELSVLESSLFRWVRDERRRLEAVQGTSAEPLSAAERTELLVLRRQVAGGRAPPTLPVTALEVACKKSRGNQLMRFVPSLFPNQKYS